MKRNENEQSLRDVLQEWIRSRRMANRLNLSRIREVWRDEMGTSINTATRDMKIIRRKLYLTIDSASLRQELQYSRDKIRERMNAALGEDFLEDVIVK